jgi:hypothetical protein
MCFMAEGPSCDSIVTNPPADEDTGNNLGRKHCYNGFFSDPWCRPDG